LAQSAVRTELVARGLETPWALAFVGQSQMLVTERPGRMRIVHTDGRVGPPLAGVPAVDAVGQGGLLDLITDSDFARNRTVYFCYAEPAAQGSGNSTALARARLSDDASRLEDLRVIFSQKPKVSSRLHFGCRVVEMPDGHLMLALGERFNRMQDAQTLDNHHGKVVRLRKDGGVPSNNPLLGQSGALPEIWSWGHRNPQGAALGPDGRLWVIEHGPQGGDEINRPEAGKNYGWPVVTFGENYGGGAIGEGTAKPGMEPPLHHWTPSIAPAGMAFVTTDRYGRDWRGSLLVGALRGQRQGAARRAPAHRAAPAHPRCAPSAGWHRLFADRSTRRAAAAAGALSRCSGGHRALTVPGPARSPVPRRRCRGFRS
jgi:glucose/arabinose dehydrogenase